MAGEPREFRTHKVYTARLWEDDWTEEEHLFCDGCTFACSTEFSHAEFRWRFGRVEAFDSSTFSGRPAKDLEGYLVMVEIEQSGVQPKRWHGVILRDARSYGGESPLPGQPVTGEQRLTAIGLEWFLARWPLDSSFCKIKVGSTVHELEVSRALPFNPAGGYRESRRFMPNMDPEGEKGPVFVENMNVDAFEWSGKDILDYLVGYHMPKDLDGEEKLTWTRADDGGVLAAFQGTLDGLHGLPLFDVLNRLMDRRRLLGWFLRVNDEETEIEIVPFNFNKDDLNLPSGTTVTANANQVEIDSSQDPLVQRLEIGRDGAVHYHRVIARGERVVVCGSMDYDGALGTFEKDWTDALKTEYQKGPSGDTSYTSLTNDIQRMDAVQEFRQQDKFRAVYQRYLMDAHTLNSHEGEDGLLPDPDSVKVNGQPIWAYPPLARFLTVLPLRDDVDYTTPSTSLDDALPDGSREEYMPPLAFLQEGARYYHLDNMSYGDTLLSSAATGGRAWGASLAMRHEALGFVLNVSGQEQHVLGKTDFTPIAAPDPDAELWAKVLEPTALDWQDIVLTVALETDTWAEAQWPDPATNEGDVQLDLVLSFPGKRMEYVMEGTAFRLNEDGTLQKATSGGWIVDDSEELKDLARVAYEWYRQARRTLTLTVRSLDCPYELGQLVTKIKRPGGLDVEEINSVITQISFDLLAGTYTIRTQFAELDLPALAPGL